MHKLRLTALAALATRRPDFTLRQQPWQQYGIVLVVLAAVSVVSLWLEQWTGYQAISLVYLLAVVLLALVVGRGPIVFGTILTAMGWSYLFAPPRWSFQISGFYDKEMVAMYFLVALTVAQLTAVLRAQRAAEQQREERSRALYLLGRDLADGADLGQIVGNAGRHLAVKFDAEVAIFLPSPSGLACAWPPTAEAWLQDKREQAVAGWAFTSNVAAGRGTDKVPEAAGFHLPLVAGGPASGVISLRFRSPNGPSPIQRQLLEEFARHIAMAVERERLREAEMNAKFFKESERLGRTLLNSVSHELRTPLSAITGAIHTLRSSGPLTLVQNEVTSEIDFAAARLNRVVQSLLSAARLQSGHLRPKMEWCDLSDVVRASLRDIGKWLAGHPIENRVPYGLPLVKADFVLLQQAVVNVLLNAAVHTPPGTPILLIARPENDGLALQISDRGAGIPADQLERIFDLFHRAPRARPGGAGLGLHIVKGFVEAQGGQVRAGNREDGGACFTIVLPMRQPELLLEEVA